jgi:hypothetical protein
MYSRCEAAKKILNQLFALSQDKKRGMTRYKRPDVEGEESVTAVGGNKMKTKVHCIKVLCCGLNHSQETGSVACTYGTPTAEYRSAGFIRLGKAKAWISYPGSVSLY